MSLFHLLVSILLIFLTGQAIFIGVSQRNTANSIKKLANQTSQTDSVKSSPSPKTDSDNTADSTASSIEEANSSLQVSLSDLQARIDKLEETKAPLTTTTSYSAPIVFQPQSIYLGSANSNKREWTDAGVEVVINSANYPLSVSAIFEAGLSIPGGEAWARLRNKSTGAVVLASQVFHNNNNIIWKSSSSFKLHNGNNTYVIQLRSTSGETVNLSGARLKISN